MNPLYQMMMQNLPSNGAASLLQQAMQFAKNFRGNPQQQVQSLLQSGRITQAQYDAAVQQANQLYNMMK